MQLEGFRGQSCNYKSLVMANQLIQNLVSLLLV